MMRLLPLLFMSLSLMAQYANEDLLPPRTPWEGKSRELAIDPNHEWATDFEKGNFEVSPNYEDTYSWFKRLVKAAPELKMVTIGKSLQGRDIFVILASKEGASSVSTLKENGRPTLFAHAGIHSGEIDGKDAAMMLLRDMTVLNKKKDLLDRANFVFIPILNPDGHERASEYGRINQRGPKVMGWRTNGRNLNLNRDYSKLETAELKALIPFLDGLEPELYFDIHVTDGIDHQYDVTYGYVGRFGYSPNAAAWMDGMRADVDRKLEAMGHIPGLFVFGVDRTDFSKGVLDWTPSPRYSNGYGDVRHLPTVLVENHSLKPYDQRVFGTYVLLEATLEKLAADYVSLRKAIEADRERRPDDVVLQYGMSTEKPEIITFKGVENRKVTSPRGVTYLEYTGKPVDMQIPLLRMNRPVATVKRPQGYWVPSDWPEVIESLKRHGVEMKPLSKAKEVAVTQYRFTEASLDSKPFEGRVRVRSKQERFEGKVLMPKGSVYISTDQPLCELIVLLLEPSSQDSYWQWGYFTEIMQRTEYFENYAMEPLAESMLKADPSLKSAYEAAMAKKDNGGTPRERLSFFYERSPYYDAAHMVYPVGRVE